MHAIMDSSGDIRSHLGPVVCLLLGEMHFCDARGVLPISSGETSIIAFSEEDV